MFGWIVHPHCCLSSQSAARKLATELGINDKSVFACIMVVVWMDEP
jgi:hypothetical protein